MSTNMWDMRWRSRLHCVASRTSFGCWKHNAVDVCSAIGKRQTRPRGVGIHRTVREMV